MPTVKLWDFFVTEGFVNYGLVQKPREKKILSHLMTEPTKWHVCLRRLRSAWAST